MRITEKEEVEKFVVCPHCKRPLYRKKDSEKELNFCLHCGIELPDEYRKMPKNKKRKGLKVKKFVICPHCRRALFKKKILKNPKMGMTVCYHCGGGLPDAFHKTSGKTKKY